MNQELRKRQETEGFKIANQIKKGAKVKPLKVLIYKNFILDHLVKKSDRAEFFVLLDLAKETL